MARHTNQTILEHLQWVHVFPVWAGGIAPGGREYRFNGKPLQPRADSDNGLHWYTGEQYTPYPGVTLGWASGGRDGQWHYMGLFLKGFPMQVQIAMVDDIGAAVALARRAVQPDESAPGGSVLREWAPVLVGVGDEVLPALHFRGWPDSDEARFPEALLQEAGLHCMLHFTSGPEPSTDGSKRPGAAWVEMTQPLGGSLGEVEGVAHEATFAAPDVLRQLMGI